MEVSYNVDLESIHDRIARKRTKQNDIRKRCMLMQNKGTFGILPFNLWSEKGSSRTTTMRHFPINPSSPIIRPADL